MRRYLGIVTAAAVLGVCGVAQAATQWKYTTRGAYSFVATPKLHPPKIAAKFHGRRSALAHGYFFIANFPNLTQNRAMVGQSGPLIVDSHMQPIWFKPVSTSVVADNLALQRYKGKPALSYWEGVVTKTGQIKPGSSDVVVLDQHYKQIAKLKAPAPWTLALHEFIISGNNAWAVATREVNGSAYGAPAGVTLVDTAAIEFSLSDPSKPIYVWDPLQHIPVSDTYQVPVTKAHEWDPYHMNSLQLTGNGTFLVSLRNTSAAYLIDKATSSPVWTLGGKHSTFKFASKSAQFAFQHDVQLHSGNLVSMFDDHCCAMKANGQFILPNHNSRGLVLKLDTTKKTATFVSDVSRGRNSFTAFLGNDQLLPNGNSLVGYGSQPYFDEYDRKGNLLLDATLPGPDLSYRVYLQHWIGTPGYPPDGAVKTRGGSATVYASWNGATEVRKWRVLAGNSSSHLRTVATKNRSGFETAIALSKSYKTYEVVALDSKGKKLGTSKPFPHHIQFGGY